MPTAAQTSHAKARNRGEEKKLTQSRRGAEDIASPAGVAEDFEDFHESSAQSALKNILLLKVNPSSSASPRLRVNGFLCGSAALRENLMAGAEC
jgi:hypothetical protein